jgi:hypothetical protein
MSTQLGIKILKANPIKRYEKSGVLVLEISDLKVYVGVPMIQTKGTVLLIGK